MSYYTVEQLATDQVMRQRVAACVTEQSMVYKDDARSSFVACAKDCLRANESVLAAFARMVAVAPGLADKAESGDAVDQSQIADGDILAAVQANFPLVADLYYGSA